MRLAIAFDCARALLFLSASQRYSKFSLCGVFFSAFPAERTKSQKKEQREKKFSISATNQAKQGLGIGLEIVKVLKNHFPTLLERLESLTDPRARRDYSMAGIVMAAIALFLFKEGSRNALNNELKQEGFLGNYQRLFGVRAPHMDTVEKVMRLLNPDELEELKAKQIQALINKKAFPKFEALKGKHL